MDDDGKIRRIQNFLALESEKVPKNSGGISYDFETSYAATRKNLWQNLKPIFVIMGITLFSVGILALALNLFVNYKNNKITVEVQEFNDLNLRRLLNLVGGTQERINDALNEKHRLEAQKSIDLNQAENERAVALETLKSMNLKNPDEIKKRETLIENTYLARMEKIKALDTEIASCDELIRLGQQQLAQYDSRSIEQATSREAELDSERQLHELEKQELIETYEARLSEMRNALSDLSASDLKRQKEEVEYVISQYDPTFSSDAEAQMLVKEENNAFLYKSSLSALNPKAPQSLESALRQQDSEYNKIKKLSSRFNSIPQKNAIPKFASTMENIAAKTLKNTADAAVETVNNLIAENENLLDQNTEFRELLEVICGTKNAKVDGFVLRLNSDNSVDIFLSNEALNKLKKSEENELFASIQKSSGGTIEGKVSLVDEKVLFFSEESLKLTEIEVGSSILLLEKSE